MKTINQRKKKVLLEILQKWQEKTFVRVFFNKVLSLRCNFTKKETLVQVFSCEFCAISKNNFFTEHIWATASIWNFVRLKFVRGVDVFC